MLRGFEYRMDMTFFSHLFVLKNCIVSLKRPKINEKEARIDPFFKKTVHATDDSTTKIKTDLDSGFRLFHGR